MVADCNTGIYCHELCDGHFQVEGEKRRLPPNHADAFCRGGVGTLPSDLASRPRLICPRAARYRLHPHLPRHSAADCLCVVGAFASLCCGVVVNIRRDIGGRRSLCSHLIIRINGLHHLMTAFCERALFYSAQYYYSVVYSMKHPFKRVI